MPPTRQPSRCRPARTRASPESTSSTRTPSRSPFWASAFRGVIPKHVFARFKGARSREAPANLKPIGTGPYRIVDFKPGDVIRAEVFQGYHEPHWPFFDRLEMKGGGDAVSSARAVMQTGEYDFAWNMQVEDELLQRMERTGKGKIEIAWGGGIEHIVCNFSDPWREVDGERSSLKAPHPFLTDPSVRSALSLLVDRAAIQEQIYGRLGRTTANYLNAPEAYRSKNTRWEFNVDKASKVLDDAGWRRGPDGIRTKDGDPGHRQADGGEGRNRDGAEIDRARRLFLGGSWER